MHHSYSLLKSKVESKRKKGSGPFLKSISLALVLTFLIQEVSFADPGLKAVSALLESPLHRLEIPRSIAIIEDSWKAPSTFNFQPSTVYLIQDAHVNESAQKNIAKTIDLILEKEKNLKYVFLEAGTGNDSLSNLRQYGTKPQREQIAKTYLKKGYIQGPDYLDLTSDKNFTLWGVEDKSLYKKGLELYKDLKGKRDYLNLYLDKIDRAIKTLKPKIFNPSLQTFDQERQKYLKEELSLTSYIELLQKEQKKRQIPENLFPSLLKLEKLKELEVQIDFEKANEEQQKAVLSLSEEDQETLKEISQDTNPFTLGYQNPKEKQGFYTYLESVIAKEGGVTKYPNLFKYFDYLKAFERLSPKDILKEQESLEALITQALLRNKDEQKLKEYADSLNLLRKLFNLKITQSEFEAIENNPKAFDIIEIEGFLNKKIMDLEQHYEDALFLDNHYQELFGKAKEFYTLTRQRDQKFLENLLKKMAEDNTSSKAILVTGGFHTEHLKVLLKQKQISFVQITPQVLQETNLKKYEEILLNQVIPDHMGIQPAAELAIPNEGPVKALLQNDLTSLGLKLQPESLAVGARLAVRRKTSFRGPGTSYMPKGGVQPKFAAMKDETIFERLRALENKNMLPPDVRMNIQKLVGAYARRNNHWSDDEGKKARVLVQEYYGARLAETKGYRLDPPENFFIYEGDILDIVTEYKKYNKDASGKFGGALEEYLSQGIVTKKQQAGTDLKKYLERQFAGQNFIFYRLDFQELTRARQGLTAMYLEFVFEARSGTLMATMVHDYYDTRYKVIVNNSALRASREAMKASQSKMQVVLTEKTISNFIRNVWGPSKEARNAIIYNIAGKDKSTSPAFEYQTEGGERIRVPEDRPVYAALVAFFKRVPDLAAVVFEPGMSTSGLEAALERLPKFFLEDFPGQKSEHRFVNGKFAMRKVLVTPGAANHDPTETELIINFIDLKLIDSEDDKKQVIYVMPALQRISTSRRLHFTGPAFREFKKLVVPERKGLFSIIEKMLRGVEGRRKTGELHGLQDFVFGGGTAGNYRLYYSNLGNEDFVVAVRKKINRSDVESQYQLENDIVKVIAKEGIQVFVRSVGLQPAADVAQTLQDDLGLVAESGARLAQTNELKQALRKEVPKIVSALKSEDLERLLGSANLTSKEVKDILTHRNIPSTKEERQKIVLIAQDVKSRIVPESPSVSTRRTFLKDPVVATIVAALVAGGLWVYFGRKRLLSDEQLRKGVFLIFGDHDNDLDAEEEIAYLEEVLGTAGKDAKGRPNVTFILESSLTTDMILEDLGEVDLETAAAMMRNAVGKDIRMATNEFIAAGLHDSAFEEAYRLALKKYDAAMKGQLTVSALAFEEKGYASKYAEKIFAYLKQKNIELVVERPSFTAWKKGVAQKATIERAWEAFFNSPREEALRFFIKSGFELFNFNEVRDADLGRLIGEIRAKDSHRKIVSFRGLNHYVTRDRILGGLEQDSVPVMLASSQETTPLYPILAEIQEGRHDPSRWTLGDFLKSEIYGQLRLALVDKKISSKEARRFINQVIDKVDKTEGIENWFKKLAAGHQPLIRAGRWREVVSASIMIRRLTEGGYLKPGDLILSKSGARLADNQLRVSRAPEAPVMLDAVEGKELIHTLLGRGVGIGQWAMIGFVSNFSRREDPTNIRVLNEHGALFIEVIKGSIVLFQPDSNDVFLVYPDRRIVYFPNALLEVEAAEFVQRFKKVKKEDLLSGARLAARGDRKLGEIAKLWGKVKQQLESRKLKLEMTLVNVLHAENPKLGMPELPVKFFDEVYQQRPLVSYELPPRAVKNFIADPASALVAQRNPFWKKALSAAKNSSVRHMRGVDASASARYTMHRIANEFTETDFDPEHKKKKKVRLSQANTSDPSQSVPDGQILDSFNLSPDEREELNANRILWLKEDKSAGEESTVVYYPPHPSFGLVIEGIKNRYSGELKKLGIGENLINDFIVNSYLAQIAALLRDVTQTEMMADFVYRTLRDAKPDELPHDRIIRLAHIGGAFHSEGIHAILGGLKLKEADGADVSIFGTGEETAVKIVKTVEDPRKGRLKFTNGSPFLASQIKEIIDRIETADGELKITDTAYFVDLFKDFLASEGKFTLELLFPTEALRAHIKAGRYVEAKDVLERALQDDPEDVGAVYNLGRVYELMQQESKMNETFEKALRMQPRSADEMCAQIEIYRKQNKLEEVKMLILKAYGAEPENRKVLINLTALYIDNGSFKKAEQILLKLLSVEEDAQARLNLVGLYLLTNRFKEARDAISRLEIGEDNNEGIQDLGSFGRSFFDAGRYTEAAIVFRKVVEVKPHSQVGWDSLAKSYEASGEKRAAQWIKINILDKGQFPNKSNLSDVLLRIDQKLVKGKKDGGDLKKKVGARLADQSASLILGGVLQLTITFDGQQLHIRDDKGLVQKSFKRDEIPALIMIGKASGNDVLVADRPEFERIDNHHAHVRRAEDGSFYLDNLSAKGAQVGKHELGEEETVPLMTVKELKISSEVLTGGSGQAEDLEALFQDANELSRMAERSMKRLSLDGASRTIIQAIGHYAEIRLQTKNAALRLEADKNLKLLRSRQHQIQGTMKSKDDRFYVTSQPSQRQGQLTTAIPSSEVLRTGERTAAVVLYAMDWTGRLILQRKPHFFGTAFPGKLAPTLTGWIHEEEANPVKTLQQAARANLGIELDPQRLERIKAPKETNTYDQPAFYKLYEFVALTDKEWERLENFKKETEAKEKEFTKTLQDESQIQGRVMFSAQEGFRRMFMFVASETDETVAKRLDEYAGQLERGDGGHPNIPSSSIRIHRADRAVFKYQFTHAEMEQIQQKRKQEASSSGDPAQMSIRGYETMELKLFLSRFFADPEDFAVEAFIPTVTKPELRKQLRVNDGQAAKPSSSVEKKLARIENEIATWYEQNSMPRDFTEKNVMPPLVEQIQFVRKLVSESSLPSEEAFRVNFEIMRSRYPEGVTLDKFKEMIQNAADPLVGKEVDGKAIATALFEEAKKAGVQDSVQSFYELAGLYSDMGHIQWTIDAGDNLYEIYSFFLDLFKSNRIHYSPKRIFRTLLGIAQSETRSRRLVAGLRHKLSQSESESIQFILKYFKSERFEIGKFQELVSVIAKSPHEYTKHLQQILEYLRDTILPEDEREAKGFLANEEATITTHAIEKHIRIPSKELDEINDRIERGVLLPFEGGGQIQAFRFRKDGLEVISRRLRLAARREKTDKKTKLDEKISDIEEKKDLYLMGDLLLEVGCFLNEIETLRKANPHGQRSNMPILLQAVEGEEFNAIKSTVVKLSDAVVRATREMPFPEVDVRDPAKEIIDEKAGGEVIDDKEPAKEIIDEKAAGEAWELFGLFKEHLYSTGLFEIEQQFPYKSDTLRKVIAKKKEEEGGWEAREVCEIAEAIAKSMAHSTRTGILHRDMKQANVVVRSRPRLVRTVDFGLSLSPEEALQDKTSLSWALWSLEKHFGKFVGTPSYFPLNALKNFNESLIADWRRDFIAFWITVLPLFGVDPHEPGIKTLFHRKKKKAITQISVAKSREALVAEINQIKGLPQIMKDLLLNPQYGIKMDFNDFKDGKALTQAQAIAMWEALALQFRRVSTSFPEKGHKNSLAAISDLLSQRLSLTNLSVYEIAPARSEVPLTTPREGSTPGVTTPDVTPAEDISDDFDEDTPAGPDGATPGSDPLGARLALQELTSANSEVSDHDYDKDKKYKIYIRKLEQVLTKGVQIRQLKIESDANSPYSLEANGILWEIDPDLVDIRHVHDESVRLLAADKLDGMEPLGSTLKQWSHRMNGPASVIGVLNSTQGLMLEKNTLSFETDENGTAHLFIKPTVIRGLEDRGDEPAEIGGRFFVVNFDTPRRGVYEINLRRGKHSFSSGKKHVEEWTMTLHEKDGTQTDYWIKTVNGISEVVKKGGPNGVLEEQTNGTPVGTPFSNGFAGGLVRRPAHENLITEAINGHGFTRKPVEAYDPEKRELFDRRSILEKISRVRYYVEKLRLPLSLETAVEELQFRQKPALKGTHLGWDTSKIGGREEINHRLSIAMYGVSEDGKIRVLQLIGTHSKLDPALVHANQLLAELEKPGLFGRKPLNVPYWLLGGTSADVGYYFPDSDLEASAQPRDKSILFSFVQDKPLLKVTNLPDAEQWTADRAFKTFDQEGYLSKKPSLEDFLKELIKRKMVQGKTIVQGDDTDIYSLGLQLRDLVESDVDYLKELLTRRGDLLGLTIGQPSSTPNDYRLLLMRMEKFEKTRRLGTAVVIREKQGARLASAPGEIPNLMPGVVNVPSLEQAVREAVEDKKEWGLAAEAAWAVIRKKPEMAELNGDKVKLNKNVIDAYAWLIWIATTRYAMVNQERDLKAIFDDLKIAVRLHTWVKWQLSGINPPLSKELSVSILQYFDNKQKRVLSRRFMDHQLRDLERAMKQRLPIGTVLFSKISDYIVPDGWYQHQIEEVVYLSDEVEELAAAIQIAEAADRLTAGDTDVLSRAWKELDEGWNEMSSSQKDIILKSPTRLTLALREGKTLDAWRFFVSHWKDLPEDVRREALFEAMTSKNKSIVSLSWKFLTRHWTDDQFAPTARTVLIKSPSLLSDALMNEDMEIAVAAWDFIISHWGGLSPAVKRVVTLDRLKQALNHSSDQILLRAWEFVITHWQSFLEEYRTVSTTQFVNNLLVRDIGWNFLKEMWGTSHLPEAFKKSIEHDLPQSLQAMKSSQSLTAWAAWDFFSECWASLPEKAKKSGFEIALKNKDPRISDPAWALVSRADARIPNQLEEIRAFARPVLAEIVQEKDLAFLKRAADSGAVEVLDDSYKGVPSPQVQVLLLLKSQPVVENPEPNPGKRLGLSTDELASFGYLLGHVALKRRISEIHSRQSAVDLLSVMRWNETNLRLGDLEVKLTHGLTSALGRTPSSAEPTSPGADSGKEIKPSGPSVTEQRQGTDNAAGNKGARLAGTDVLTTFFARLVHAQTITKADLALDRTLFHLESQTDGSLTATTYNGSINLRLTKEDIKIGQKTGKINAGPSVSGLMLITTELNRDIDRSLDAVPTDFEQAVLVEYDPDFLNNDSSGFYLEALKDEFRYANTTAYGKKAYFIKKGEEIPEWLKDAPKVILTPSNKPLYEDRINIPIESIKEGDIPAFRTILRLAITAGRINTRNPHPGFLDAYSTLAGLKIDAEDALLILNGLADAETVLKFALRPMTSVDINLAIQFFRMMRKQIDQAA